MADIKELMEERNQILEKIDGLVAMRRGSMTRQFVPVVKNGKPTREKRGPYNLFSYKKNGRTVSRRVKDKNELRRLNRQVENYHLFQKLCQRLMEIGEEICQEHEKKNR